jgi:hypothetical protein
MASDEKSFLRGYEFLKPWDGASTSIFRGSISIGAVKVIPKPGG